jgi:thymidylate synthase
MSTPIIILGENVDQIFARTARTLFKIGTESAPHGQKTLELRNAWLEITNPGDGICHLPSRNIDLKYLEGELDWYLSGSLKVADIEKHSKFWSKLADSNGTVNSNYGFLTMIEKHGGLSQVEWCIQQLRTDIDTRQAIMNYNQPRHKYIGNKDFVCTVSQEFRVDQFGSLNSVVHMRSNDLIFGLTFDAPWFVYVQKLIADAVGLKIGSYSHFASSLHVYERHFPMLREIASELPDEYDKDWDKNNG